MNEARQIRSGANDVVQDKGLVAYRDIEKGTLIMKEEELLVCNTDKTPRQWEQQAAAFYAAERAGTTSALQTAVNALQGEN